MIDVLWELSDKTGVKYHKLAESAELYKLYSQGASFETMTNWVKKHLK